jgi:Protein of unknown function (DUF4238)
VNQHLLSRVLLARFSDKKKGPISGLDLDALTIRTDLPKKFGGVEDLLPEPEELEQVWNSEVEMRLPHAFDLLDQGRLFDDPAAVETVKKCIALHWARSPMTIALIGETKPRYADRVVQSLLSHFDPNTALRALSGIEVPGPTAYEVAAAKIRETFDRKLEEEGFLKGEFVRNFDRARELIAPKGLEVREASQASGEFLIADMPVVLYDHSSDRVGVRQGVSWDQATNLFMALGPRHVVALSKQNSYEQADARLVEILNVLQVRGAYREVYFRPSSGLGDILVGALGRDRGAPD